MLVSAADLSPRKENAGIESWCGKHQHFNGLKFGKGANDVGNACSGVRGPPQRNMQESSFQKLIAKKNALSGKWSKGQEASPPKRHPFAQTALLPSLSCIGQL